MSSQRRINASRHNGALSRSPQTEAGKLRSSRNNLRHGILAQTVVLADEDKEAFIEHLTAFEDEHQPQDHTELDLVETMAIARWRTRRIWALEKANLDYQIQQDRTPGRDGPTRAALAFRKLCDESRSADLLGRYETRYDRQYYRAFNLLLKKRAASPPQTPAPGPVAAPVPPVEPCGPPESGPPHENLPFEPNPDIEHRENPGPSLATKLLALAAESKDTRSVSGTSFQIASGGVD